MQSCREPPRPTFHQLVDECAEVVGLLLPAFAHLHDVGKVLAHILQQPGAHLHFSLEESEQRILRSLEENRRLEWSGEGGQGRGRAPEVTWPWGARVHSIAGTGP